jgi:hypothetical protein
MKTTSLRILGSTLSWFAQRTNTMLWTMLGMLLVGTALSLNAQPTLSGLVGHWNFDEGSGLVTADSSGYGNAGRLADGTVWLQNQARPPFVLFFDGVNDHVNVVFFDFDNGAELFRATSAPYEFDWTPATQGQHRVVGLAYATDGGVDETPIIVISVQ